MALSRGARIVLLFISLAVTVSVIGLALGYYLVTREPTVESESVLWLRVPAVLNERSPDDPFSLLSGGEGSTVGSIIGALRKAKVDDRVSAVVLAPSPNLVSWAAVQEIRDAVTDYRASGKPIVGYLEFGLRQAYYLASACDEVIMTPSSPLLLVGVAAYELFLRGALDKMGLEADMVSAGDYKTAINIYTETTFTPEHREATEAIARDLYEQLIDGIAEGRGMTPARIRALIDEGPFVPADALRHGLVDELAYEDELLARLAPDDDEPATIKAAAYRRVSARSLGLDVGPRIAVVYAEGPILMGTGGGTVPGFSPTIGSRTTADAIHQAREDDSIEAIVLRVNSPGGDAVASDIIWRELVLARDEKPLIVSMSEVAASGGYYIAAPAHAIVAQPGTVTGSIGVFSGKFAAGRALEKLGVGMEGVAYGAQADLFSPVDRFSDAGRAAMQAQVDDTYERFLQVVVDGRAMNRDAVHAVGQGRIWTGRQAVERGLVDELGGLRHAIDLAKARADIDADREVTLVAYPGRRSLLETLRGAGSTFGPAGAWLVSPAARAAQALWWHTRLASRGAPLLLMPGVLVP